MVEVLLAEMFGLGSLQQYLDDEEIENIDVNGCDHVFVTYADGRCVRGAARSPPTTRPFSPSSRTPPAASASASAAGTPPSRSSTSSCPTDRVCTPCSAASPSGGCLPTPPCRSAVTASPTSTSTTCSTMGAVDDTPGRLPAGRRAGPPHRARGRRHQHRQDHHAAGAVPRDPRRRAADHRREGPARAGPAPLAPSPQRGPALLATGQRGGSGRGVGGRASCAPRCA